MRQAALLLVLLATPALACRGLLAASLDGLGGDSSVCQSCMAAVRVFDDFLCDPAATEFLVDFMVNNVCPVIGKQDEGQCVQMVEALTPVAIEWFRATATPEYLCSSAGVCDNTLEAAAQALRKARASPRLRDGMECSMCRYVVNYVKAEVDDPAMLEKIKEKALEACTTLPDDLSKSCTDLVTNYDKILVTFIDNINANATCSKMGLCAGSWLAQSGALLPPLSAPLVATATALHKLARLVAVASQGNGNAKAVQLGIGNTCDNCRMAVLELHSLLTNQANRDKVVEYMKAACESMAQTMVDTCKGYVDQYSAPLFDALAKYIDKPDTLCTQLHMCPAKAVASSSQSTWQKAVSRVSAWSVLRLGGARN